MEDDFKIAKNFLSEKEFVIYRKREMKNLVSDFDKAKADAWAPKACSGAARKRKTMLLATYVPYFSSLFTGQNTKAKQNRLTRFVWIWTCNIETIAHLFDNVNGLSKICSQNNSARTKEVRIDQCYITAFRRLYIYWHTPSGTLGSVLDVFGGN